MGRLSNIPRKWLMLIYSGIGILVILITATIVANRIIQHTVSEQLQHLSPKLKISYSSIKSNLFTSSLALSNLTIAYTPDSSHHQHAMHFSSIELNGIHLLEMLFRRTLSINHLNLNNGEIDLDRFLMNRKDTAPIQLLAQAPVKSISINHLQLGPFQVREDHQLLLSGNVGIDDINIHHLKDAFAAGNFHFGDIKGSLSGINYPLPNAYHTLMVKQVTIDSRQGLLEIDSLQLLPQYSKADFFPKTDNQPLFVKAGIAYISIHNVDIRKLFDKKLVAEKIILNHPVLNIYSETTTRRPSSLFIDLTKMLSAIQTDSFRMRHAAIACETTTGAQLKLHGDMEIDKPDIRITDSLPGIRFKTLACALTDIQASIPGARQNLQIKQLDVDREGSLQAASLKVTPQYDKVEMGRKAGHQVDVVDASISGVTITKLDINKCLQQQLVAEQIWIKESNFYIFRDRRLPRLSQYKPLPVAFLKSIPGNIRVQRFKVSASTLLYEEFPKDKLQTGLLRFERLQLSVAPLINNPIPSDPDHMDLNMEGSIMGSGTIKTAISLPFTAGKSYNVNGTIDNLDVTTLNPSAENLGNFHVESGLLNHLAFQFSFNDEKASGKVVGEYHNLVLDKLKGQQKKIAKFPSFMLKHVIIPKNKDKSLPVDRRTGTIDYKFDHTRALSFYLLKSLLSGIEASFTFGFLLPK
ncbi:DUF748 domain-containing protein [Chitinophaga polysaccharea]|uniref:DUF748 domain-containing protein n=1 Tax=Chitinophaga polysaccharea TaxID=1293035 RepID=UPI0014551D60|nr:DUF748 domain-containing protein [Chitinophaga polysaccharea]NLR57655.1 DUF748 domain-containing protein [Chitinophaga polysaccharea]